LNSFQIPIPESEVITPQDIDYIIEFNKEMTKRTGEEFCLDSRKYLEGIFTHMNDHNYINNGKQRVIKKAAHILAGIAYYQPFCEANKRTSLAITIPYLRRNGLLLHIRSKTEQKEIHNLLVETIVKPTNHATIFSEVEEFLVKRVIYSPSNEESSY
jgi:prophage maintenance system killer protein